MSKATELLPLLERIAMRDERAFEEFHRQTRALLLWHVRRLLRDGRDAEEVVEEVYRYVWVHGGEFRAERGNVHTWLYMLGRSRALDRLRREQRRPVGVPMEDAQSLMRAEHPEEGYLWKMWGQSLRRLLGELPGEQRRLVELAFFEGHSHSEIAAVTGMKLGTVKSRIRGALLRLREELTPDGALPQGI